MKGQWKFLVVVVVARGHSENEGKYEYFYTINLPLCKSPPLSFSPLVRVCYTCEGFV